MLIGNILSGTVRKMGEGFVNLGRAVSRTVQDAPKSATTRRDDPSMSWLHTALGGFGV